MSAGSLVYLDTSALAKLVTVEAESSALRAFLRGRPQRVSSAVAVVELGRFARRHGSVAVTVAQRLFRDIQLISIDDALIEVAARIGTEHLRSLDAIHLATALSLNAELGHVVTYDRRMQEAAQTAWLAVAAPA